MTWLLLDELRALAAEDGCLETPDDVAEMEFRIADETGVGRLDNDYLDGMQIPVTIANQVKLGTWRDSPVAKWPTPNRSCGAPFLESSDAAALLEKELVRCLRARSAGMPSIHFSHTWWPMPKVHNGQNVIAEVFGLPNRDYVSAWAKTEPIARTLAVMGAGHELGIWPIRAEEGGTTEDVA